MLSYTVSKYITLRLEQGKTFIYVNNRRFLQCIRLILQIPQEDAHNYDEINSIDEAEGNFKKYVYQNQIIKGAAAQYTQEPHDITPEQEFWGHCSNIQAWVENNYDTRLLFRNMAFPLLKLQIDLDDILARSLYHLDKSFKEQLGQSAMSEFSKSVLKFAFYLCVTENTCYQETSLMKISDTLKISSDPTIHFFFDEFFTPCANFRKNRRFQFEFSSLREEYRKFLFSNLLSGTLHRRMNRQELKIFLHSRFNKFPHLSINSYLNMSKNA